jgi:alpha-L-rhamnosidase
MKNKIFIAGLLCSLLSQQLIACKSPSSLHINKSAVTGFSTADAAKRYNIADHGAKGDGTTLNTTIIQSVIDECAKNGGGIVVVPKGEFLSGSVFFKQGVEMELLEGAVLRGSTNILDYPKGMTRIEGHSEPWPAALINADKITHLRITGKGTLDGCGQPFWKEFYDRRDKDPKTTNLNVERPRLAFIQHCDDVQIKGIAFKNSGFWNLHLYRCTNVLVEDCSFKALSGPKPNNAPSSDGIDVDCSQDVTISKSFFSVGDDCIALKGSKGPFAMDDKESPAVERIIIKDCIFEAGGGIVTFGSEATIIRDVTVQRCTTRKPNVLRLKLRPDTPQLYENVTLTDITMEGGGVIFNVAPWSQYFDLKGQQPPKSIVRNISITGVKGAGSSFGKITGNKDTEFGNILLKDVDVQMTKPILELGDVKTVKFENVKANGVEVQAPAPNTKAEK